MTVKENHLDDVPARSKQLIEAKFVFNTKEDAFIKKVQGKTYYMPILDIETMPDDEFKAIVAEAATEESIGGEIEPTTAPSAPDVSEVLGLQRQVQELVGNPKFVEAFKLKAQLDEQIKEGEKKLAGIMVLSHTKKIEGDWGYITLVERDSFSGDIDELDPKYVKQAADAKAIGDHFKLTGELPNGATIKSSTFLRKKIN